MMSQSDFRIILLKKIASSSGILSSFVEKTLNERKQNFKVIGSAGPGTGIAMSDNAIKPDGTVDIIINFRGVSATDTKSLAMNFSNPNAVIVTAEATGAGAAPGPNSKNKGSAMLVQQFAGASKINEIVAKVLSQLQAKYPDKKIKRGKLIISGFSGGGSVVARAVAERNKITGGIDGVVINDGLHTDVNSDIMKEVVGFANEAKKDSNKKFKIIHTAIEPGYTSTTQTANFIIDNLGLKRNAVNPDEFLPYGFVPKSKASEGGVEIVQMYDKGTPYFIDNRTGSLGDQHIQSLWKGNPYLFRNML